MRSILAVALFAAAAPMILAEGTDPVETTQQVVNQALDGAQLPPMDAADATAATHAAIEEVKDTTATLANAAAGEGAATLDLTNGVPALTTEVPANAVVINLTPGSKQGCYTIGEATTALAEFCEKDGAAVSDPIKIGTFPLQLDRSIRIRANSLDLHTLHIHIHHNIRHDTQAAWTTSG